MTTPIYWARFPKLLHLSSWAAYLDDGGYLAKTPQTVGQPVSPQRNRALKGEESSPTRSLPPPALSCWTDQAAPFEGVALTSLAKGFTVVRP